MKIKHEKAPEVPADFARVRWQGVIIKKARLEIEDKIIIAEQQRTAINEGWVMGLGPDVISKELKTGMRIVFNNLANLWFIHNEETYLALHESDVYGYITTDEEGVDTLHPLARKVFIRKGQSELKMKSGIYLPDNQKQINFGQVIGVGEGCRDDLKVGQMVVYNFYANTELMFRNKVVASMADIDVYVILANDSFAGIDNTIKPERRPDIPLDQLPEIQPKETLTGVKTHYNKKQK